MAEDHPPAGLAAAAGVAEHPAHLARVAQDHNGLSHQDPGFIDHAVNKKADTIRVYLPPDANCSCLSPTTACAAATMST